MIPNRKSIECHNLRGGLSKLILLLSKDPDTQSVGLQMYNGEDNEVSAAHTFDIDTTNTVVVSILNGTFISTGYMSQDDLREVMNFIREVKV